MVLATPIRAIEEVMKLIGPELEDGCVVTDTGSTKVSVLQWAEENLPSNVSFVGGHPMAGKEESGPDAAQVDLFQGATLLPHTGPEHRAGRSWNCCQLGGGNRSQALLH